MVGHRTFILRAVASLTVPAGQEFHFPHFFLRFRLIFLIFPQTLLIFFLILALWVGESPTREALATPLIGSAVWFYQTPSLACHMDCIYRLPSLLLLQQHSQMIHTAPLLGIDMLLLWRTLNLLNSSS